MLGESASSGLKYGDSDDDKIDPELVQFGRSYEEDKVNLQIGCRMKFKENPSRAAVAAAEAAVAEESQSGRR